MSSLPAADASVGDLLPQLVGAGIYQLVERGLLAVPQHPVNDLISHQSFSVDRHIYFFFAPSFTSSIMA